MTRSDMPATMQQVLAKQIAKAESDTGMPAEELNAMIDCMLPMLATKTVLGLGDLTAAKMLVHGALEQFWLLQQQNLSKGAAH